MATRQTDWLARQTIPDVYHRKDDPFRPDAGSMLLDAPDAALFTPGQYDIYAAWLTQPAARPIVYQRGLNFSMTVQTTPLPLTNGQFQCDTIVLDVYNSAANSIFFGYGSGITVNSGIEVRAGLPIAISPDNSREQWEIQRLLEVIAGMIAAERGYQPLPNYKAPRVVFNTNDIYVVAAAATQLSVMLFLVPEFQ